MIFDVFYVYVYRATSTTRIQKRKYNKILFPLFLGSTGILLGTADLLGTVLLFLALLAATLGGFGKANLYFK